MKDIFPGHLPERLTLETLKNSIVTFDANSILNLYRFRPETSTDYINALKVMPGNLWLTFMAALEYNSLRITVIKQEQEFLDSVRKDVTAFKNKMEEVLNKEHKHFPFDDFRNTLLHATEKMNKLILDCQSEQKDIIRNDPIRDELFNIFRGRTGAPISEEILSNIYAEAEERFNYEIPPGYKDKKNKENAFKLYGAQRINTKYSDFIIWHEIIEKAKREKKPIVFITDEKKDDWVLKVNGYVLSARPELINELMIKANQQFHLASSKDFISIMKSSGMVRISQASVEDIEQVTSLSWREIIVTAFSELDGEANLNELYDWIEKNNPRSLSKNWKVTARKTIYNYCRDRDIFLGGEHLFDALPNGRYRLVKN